MKQSSKVVPNSFRVLLCDGLDDAISLLVLGVVVDRVIDDSLDVSDRLVLLEVRWWGAPVVLHVQQIGKLLRLQLVVRDGLAQLGVVLHK